MNFADFLAQSAPPKTKAQAPRAQAPKAPAPKAQASKQQAASRRVASRRKIIEYLMNHAPETHRDPDPLMPGERELPGAANAELRRIYWTRLRLLEEAREIGDAYLDTPSEVLGLELDSVLRRFDKYGKRREPVIAAYLDAHDYLAENRAYKQKIASGWAEPTHTRTMDPDIPVDDRGPHARATQMAFPVDEDGGPQRFLGLRVKQVKKDPKTWRYQPYEVFVPSSEFTYDSEGLRYPISPVTPDLPRRGQLGFSEMSHSRWSGMNVIIYTFERLHDAMQFAQKVGPGTEVIAYDTEMLRNTLLADAVWNMIRPASVSVHTIPPKRGKYHGPRREIWTWNGKDWGPHHKQSFDLDYAQYVNFRVPDVDVALPVGTKHTPGIDHRTNQDPTVLDRDAFYIGLSALKQARLDHGKWVWPSMPREDARVYVTPGRPASPKKPAQSGAGFDPKVHDRYMKVRAHAQRGVENQRDNARRILLSMQAEFPWLRG